MSTLHDRLSSPHNLKNLAVVVQAELQELNDSEVVWNQKLFRGEHKTEYLSRMITELLLRDSTGYKKFVDAGGLELSYSDQTRQLIKLKADFEDSSVELIANAVSPKKA
jgi:hypothetical protein